MNERRLTLIGHLEELRRRILISLVALLIGIGVVWAHARELLDALLAPLGQPVIYLSPMGGFLMVFKVALFAGAALASPVMLWQVLGFVLPALKARERRLLFISVAMAVSAFVLGIWFSWKWILPGMVQFGLAYQTANLKPFVTADEYFSFVFLIVGSCGVAFELPVLTAALSALGLLTWRTLLRQWRISVFGCWVVAAIITPTPDPVNMSIVAVPLSGLFFAGVLTAWLFGKNRKEAR